MSKIIPGWYLLYTMPKYEQKVNIDLEKINITSFCPMKKSRRQWSDRIKVINSPLFPSYIFIYLNNFSEYYQCLKIKGSLYFVKIGKEICRVSDQVMSNLKVICAQDTDIFISTNEFEKGQIVTINQGYFVGMECEVINFENKKNLVVRLEILNRNVLVKLPNNYLMTS